MQTSVWRVLQTAPASGAWNMALDEAILEAVGQGAVLPTLRLYGWQPPCLSLGYAQPVSDVDFDQLRARAWQLVRRPTGGRAILHADELTYSVIAPLREPRVYGSILESYRHLSQALLLGLQRLGVDAHADRVSTTAAPKTAVGPVCFEVPSTYEITVGGKKLIGSAQARRREGVLQHGSLPLFGNLTRIVEVLRFSDENERQAAADRLRERALTIENCLARPVTWQSAAQALMAGFEEALALQLSPQQPSPQELNRTEQLMQEKYNHPDWTNRV